MWIPTSSTGSSGDTGLLRGREWIDRRRRRQEAGLRLAEIYYNDAFGWGIDAFFPLADVEGTALHETGHGLGQAHFGKIFITLANGKVHFSPFAVMNAVDPGFPAQVLQGDRHRRTLQHLGELAEPLADEFPP